MLTNVTSNTWCVWRQCWTHLGPELSLLCCLRKLQLPFLCMYSGMISYVADKIKEHITGNILANGNYDIIQRLRKAYHSFLSFSWLKGDRWDCFSKTNVLKSFKVFNISLFSADAIIWLKKYWLELLWFSGLKTRSLEKYLISLSGNFNIYESLSK